MIDLKALEERLWANKVAKGFNVTDLEREFNFTYGELAEAYEAWRKGKGREAFAGELADVVLYVMSLARMEGVDLEAALLAKMAENEQRVYKKVDGRNVRVEDDK